MEQHYYFYLLVGAICMVIDIGALILISAVGVMLADTRLISSKYIYMTRFIPMGVLFLRVSGRFLLEKISFEQVSDFIKVWFPFLVLAILSSLYSLQPIITLQRAISACFVVIGFGLAAQLYLNDRVRYTRILKQVTVLMACGILYALFLKLTGAGVVADTVEYERVHGIYKNPNTLGLLAMQTIFLMMYWWQDERNKLEGKIILVLAVAVGVTLLASGSRASFLGLIVGLIIFALASAKLEMKTQFEKLLPGLILLFIIGITFYIFPNLGSSLFRTETGSRSILWERGWELSRLSPYYGVGFGGSDPLFMEDALYLKRMGVYLAGPHSSLMRLLVDLGYLGIGLAFYAFYVLISRAWKILPYLKDPMLGVTLLAIVGASLTNSFFESWLFAFGSSSTVPFWFMFALLCGQTEYAFRREKILRSHKNFSPYKNQFT